ncbi:hypothetical protein WUBG_18130 [Wuchereria bancrofti]|nr:hypothetical protein WUBG_18130 [Wuchereria bancrofti]
MRNQTTRHGSSQAQTIQKLIDNDCLCEAIPRLPKIIDANLAFINYKSLILITLILLLLIKSCSA